MSDMRVPAVLGTGFEEAPLQQQRRSVWMQLETPFGAVSRYRQRVVRQQQWRCKVDALYDADDGGWRAEKLWCGLRQSGQNLERVATGRGTSHVGSPRDLGTVQCCTPLTVTVGQRNDGDVVCCVDSAFFCVGGYSCDVSIIMST